VGDAAATPPPIDPRITTAMDATDLVRSTARAFELDRYLSALLAPRSVRRDLVALAAFAGEIGRIPTFVSEPMVGEIRLQWWRDTIAAMAQPGLVTGHPIADTLTSAVQRHALPTRLLLSAIDAQLDRLRDSPFTTLPALLANIDQSDGAHFALAWHVLSGGRNLDIDGQNPSLRNPPPAGLAAAARAYGLARTLIEMPVLLANGHILLPQDRLAAHRITVENLHLPDSRPGLAAVFADLSATVLAQLSEARATFLNGGQPLRMAILPTALVRPYLRLSELSDTTPLKVGDLLPITRVARLWAAARLGIF
jgi:15-cis-phytoene synthase